jgi:hypothetical protein
MSETRQAEYFPDLSQSCRRCFRACADPHEPGVAATGIGRRASRTYVDWWLAGCGLIVLLLIVAAWDMTTKPGL